MNNGFVIPNEGRWTFEQSEIAQGFDAHVREQLPFYELVTGAVAHLARHYIPRNGLVYDIGASTGNIGRAIEAILDDRQARLIPIEASGAMCEAYQGPHRGNLVHADALDVDYQPFDLAVLFLAFMFLPPADRSAYLNRLVGLIRPGGAIILVDKIEPEGGYGATALWRLTLAGKVAAGVEPRDIVAKELSLAGVQRPLMPGELPPNARLWFRFGDFAGWLIEASSGGPW